MSIVPCTIRRATVALGLLTFTGCGQAGALGSVLGSVLGGGQQQQQQGGQVSGTVVRVDSRNQQLTLQQSNGQNIGLQYDNNTRVVYQNQNYSVANLESGDMVTARVQQTQNGGYYVDLIQVDQSRSSNQGSSNAQVQLFQGTVRQIDANNGLFVIDASNNVRLTVSMPYNATRADQTRFQNLRNGDFVRFYGAYVNNTRVELRQFN